MGINVPELVAPINRQSVLYYLRGLGHGEAHFVVASSPLPLPNEREGPQ